MNLMLKGDNIMRKNITKKILKIGLLTFIISFTTSCDEFSKDYFRIISDDVICTTYSFKIQIETNSNVDMNEVEFVPDNFNWLIYNKKYLGNNTFSMNIKNIYNERGTAYITAKYKDLKDSIKLHYVSAGNIIFSLANPPCYLETGKTYDFDWEFYHNLNTYKFAIELDPIRGLDCFQIVDQYKIKTLKAGKIKFAARIDENINIYNFEII